VLCIIYSGFSLLPTTRFVSQASLTSKSLADPTRSLRVDHSIGLLQLIVNLTNHPPLDGKSDTNPQLPCKSYSLFPVGISQAPLVRVSPALGITYSLLISSVSCESKIRYLLTSSTSIRSLPTCWLTLSTQQNGQQQRGRKSRGAQALREAQGPADGTKPTSRLLPDYRASVHPLTQSSNRPTWAHCVVR
jgi:hypothetical protein